MSELQCHGFRPVDGIPTETEPETERGPSRTLLVYPYPCRESAVVFFDGTEPVELVVDGRVYAIRPTKRGRRVSQITGCVELAQWRTQTDREAATAAAAHTVLDRIDAAIGQVETELASGALQPGDQVSLKVDLFTVGEPPESDPAA